MNWVYLLAGYLFGMFFIGTKHCCFCGDHAGSDLISLIFWFIVAPYNWIKDKFNSQSNENAEKEGEK